MKKRKLWVSILAGLLALIMILSLVVGVLPELVNAKSSSQLKEELNALKSDKKEIDKQIKELETLKNEMANRVKAFMGNSGGGECDKYRVSWKSTTRSTFDVKRFAEDHQDIDLSEYYKESSARTFRVTEQKGE